jgi:hypothetical protein
MTVDRSPSEFGLPYWLTDHTGNFTDTAFTEYYDRITLNLHQTIQRPDRTTTVLVLNRFTLAAVMDYGRKHSLGSITFPPAAPVTMESFLRRRQKSGKYVLHFNGRTGPTLISHQFVIATLHCE